jgi:tRNA(Ile)-lysidine synthase
MTADAMILVTRSEFANMMAEMGSFSAPFSIAVAVSGGPDSMALCLLLADWVRDQGGRLIALTVDHGLRPESAEEAQQVSRWLAACGIAHHILTWDGDKPSTAIQTKAREARYDLMEKWCRRNHVATLAVGHQRHDQAETFLLRLMHGSGLDGLASMAANRRLGDVRLIRPLLSISKPRVLATLAERGQAFISDPSNDNLKYERVRVRRLMDDIPLSEEAITSTVVKLGQARASMERLVDRAETVLVSRHLMGFAVVDYQGLLQLPFEIAVRVMSRLVRQIGGKRYPPNTDAVLRLLIKGTGTLAGCRVEQHREDVVMLCRENRGVEPRKSVIPGGRVQWDGRFFVDTKPECPANAQVGALGAEGWKQIKDRMTWSIPASIRATLPAIWVQDRAVKIPHLSDKFLNGACIFTEWDYFSIQALNHSEAVLDEGRNTL